MTLSRDSRFEKQDEGSVQSHAHYLLLALSRAAHSIQQAQTAEDFYTAVGREIKQLGGEVTLMLLNDDQATLSIVYTSYSSTLIRRAEKMTGLFLHDHPIPINPENEYGLALRSDVAIFTETTAELVADILPKALHSFAPLVTSMFNLRQGILAPLRAGDHVLGLLKVNGTFLSRDDIPAMQVFASHVATGLTNIRLMKNLQDELAAHQRTERQLDHHRDLLFSLNRAAYSVHLACTPDEVFQVVGEQIRSLGFEATILFFDGDKVRLRLQYTTLPQEALWAAEKLTGMTLQDFRWTLRRDSEFGEILKKRRAIFIPDADPFYREALPSIVQPVMSKLMDTLRAGPSIVAPLYVDDEMYGSLVVFGRNPLRTEDLPVMESFAAQVSVSLRNVQLNQKLEMELQERRQVEEALRISYFTFEGILNSVTEAIYIQDENGVFLNVNQSAEKMYGYPRENFIGRTPEFLAAPGRNDHQRPFHQINRVFNGEPVEFEFWGINRDGVIFPTDVRLTQGMYFGKKVVIAVARDITERKKAEENLKQQNDQINGLYQITAALNRTDVIEDIYDIALASLCNILNMEHVAILLFDGKGVVRFTAWRGLSEEYRKAVEGHSPWKPGDLSPQPVLIPDVLQDAGLTSLHAALEKEGIRALGFIPLVHQDELLGKFMLYFNSPHDFTDMEVQLARAVASHVAIAINKNRINNALRVSEERYRVLYENNPSMYFTTDEAGVILSVNQSGVKQSGFMVGELMGRSLFDIFHPDDREFVRQQIELCLQDTERTVQLEARKVRKDGSVFWVREFARAVPGVDGRYVILIVCNDVTEEVKAQDALYRSEAELRALFSSMTDSVLVIDREGVYKSIAPTSPEYKYISPEEVVGKSLSAFFPKEKVEEFMEVIRQVLKTGDTVRLEYEIVLAGASPWFEASVSPLDFDTTIWVTRDITNRKRSEDELRHANTALRAAHKELQQMFEHEQVLARTDSLTQLYNRRHFFDLAVREFDAAVRYQRPLTLILFDVDDFKQANDSFGHAFGDEVLIGISNIAKAQVRRVDILARYGGDEFIVLLPETDKAKALLTAERIREQIENHHIGVETAPFPVTISLGISEINFTPLDQSIENIIRRADQALYKAKQHGRNHAVVYSAE